MRYALITGGLGFIGSFVARQLLDEERVDKVVCLDHFGRYTNSFDHDIIDSRRLRFEGIRDRVVVERGDAKYYSVVRGVMERYLPSYVFHLAALPLARLDNMNTREMCEGCVDSTTCLLEILAQLMQRGGYSPERFVYCSSSMVYGDFESQVASEIHPTRPRNVYGTMKLAGEEITLGLGLTFGIPVSIVRPSAVYGPTDINQRVSQIFLERALQNQTLDIRGGDVLLDFTYVRDVANGLVLAATEPGGIGETFNITYGMAHNLMDYVDCLRAHFPDLKCEFSERDGSAPKRGTLAIDKARGRLGYEPRYSLKAGVAEYVEFVRGHMAPAA